MTCISTTLFVLTVVSYNNVLISSRRSGRRIAWLSIEYCDIVNSIREIHERITGVMNCILFGDFDRTPEYRTIITVWESRANMAANFIRFTRLKDRLMENHLQQFNPERIRATLDSIRESLEVNIVFEEEIEL